MVSGFVNVHGISGSENIPFLFLLKTNLWQFKEFLDLNKQDEKLKSWWWDVCVGGG